MVKRKRSYSQNFGFWPSLFLPEDWQINNELNFENKDETCSLTSNSLWNLVKNVNEEAIKEIKQIVMAKPGCRQLVLCEISYYIPDNLRK